MLKKKNHSKAPECISFEWKKDETKTKERFTISSTCQDLQSPGFSLQLCWEAEVNDLLQFCSTFTCGTISPYVWTTRWHLEVLLSSEIISDITYTKGITICGCLKWSMACDSLSRGSLTIIWASHHGLKDEWAWDLSIQRRTQQKVLLQYKHFFFF